MVPVLALKLLSAALSVAVPIFSFLGTRYLNRRLKLNLTNEEEQQLLQFAQEGVKFAEQRFKYEESSDQVNQEKFAAARNHILRNAARSGVQLDEGTIKTLIEQTVYEVNRESEKAAEQSKGS